MLSGVNAFLFQVQGAELEILRTISTEIHMHSITSA